MASAAAEALSRRLGAVVWGLSGAWYGRHMAAAERAIRTRLPLVDLVLEVRDARVWCLPLTPAYAATLAVENSRARSFVSQISASSAFGPLSRRTLEPNARRVVVLNKADLADPSETKVINSEPCAERRASLLLVLI
jgi:mitochondrial GTPase 1